MEGRRERTRLKSKAGCAWEHGRDVLDWKGYSLKGPRKVGVSGYVLELHNMLLSNNLMTFKSFIWTEKHQTEIAVL